MLNAGRGNPNWIATEPREAFFLLGQFGLCECRHAFSLEEGIAGIPQKAGIAARFEAFLKENEKAPGANLLKEGYNYMLMATFAKSELSQQKKCFAWFGSNPVRITSSRIQHGMCYFLDTFICRSGYADSRMGGVGHWRPVSCARPYFTFYGVNRTGLPGARDV